MALVLEGALTLVGRAEHGPSRGADVGGCDGLLRGQVRQGCHVKCTEMGVCRSVGGVREWDNRFDPCGTLACTGACAIDHLNMHAPHGGCCDCWRAIAAASVTAADASTPAPAGGARIRPRCRSTAGVASPSWHASSPAGSMQEGPVGWGGGMGGQSVGRPIQDYTTHRQDPLLTATIYWYTHALVRGGAWAAVGLLRSDDLQRPLAKHRPIDAIIDLTH